MMSQAACNDFTGLMIARFFLGVSEAAIAPGFSLLTSLFYTRAEQPLRHGIWFLGNSCATIIGGILSYSIGDIHGSLASWRLLFLIFGAITAFWAFVLFFLLPDNPATVTWLNKNERDIAVARSVQNSKTMSKSTRFQWAQALEALRDPQAWCLVIYIFSVNVANGGISAVSGPISSQEIPNEQHSSAHLCFLALALLERLLCCTKCPSELLSWYLLLLALSCPRSSNLVE